MRIQVHVALAIGALSGICCGGVAAEAMAARAPIASKQRTAVAARPTAAFATIAAAAASGEAPSAVEGWSGPGLGPSSGLPYPPDQFGAIGPDHYVQGVTNTGVAVFSRSGLGKVAGPLPAGTFAAAPAYADVVDTQMMWDAQTSRWYYAFSYKRWQNGNRSAGLLYGWSRTADPTDLAHGWCRMRIDNGADFDDRPKLGDNLTRLIVATNADPWSGADYDRVWTMPKPARGDTSCPASQSDVKVFGSVAHPLETSDGDIVDSAIAAQDNDGAPNGWIVAADDRARTNDELMLWHVDPSGDLVPDGNIAVASYSTPPAAPQPGANAPLDPVDERLGSAIADTDPDVGATAVWASHTIADPAGSGRSVVRWYELVPPACAPLKGACSTAARRQQGEVRDPSAWLFNAALAPTDAGNEAVIHYDSASTTRLVQVRARSRASGTPLGTLSDELVVDTSDAPYDEPTCHDDRPYCRWGDYSSATTDPSDPHAVWGSNEAIGPANGGMPNWKTRNFALRPGASEPEPEPGPPPDPTPDPDPDPVPPTPPPPPKRGPNEIAVMSRNLAAGRPDAAARMVLVAREIAAWQPDLVGLQAIALPGGGDLLDTLQVELGRLGLNYTVVAGRRGHAVLARAVVKVTGTRSNGFEDELDASVGRVRFHFVNAALDRHSAAVRLFQARTLVGGPLRARRVPVVLAGDLESGPHMRPRARRAPYLALLAAGLREARLPAYTCCFAGDLTSGEWTRSADHLMARAGLFVVRSAVTGSAPRTPSGRAASTHGGLVTVLRRKP
jgi:endonuclease/exonuclease/phosphatase family metal-dependent hydrolase